MAGIHASIAVSALGLVLVAGMGVEWRSAREPAKARFWFDSPTFELPPHTTRRHDRLTPLEIRRIECVARFELQQAFGGLRLTFTDSSRAIFQVRVVQDLPLRPGPRPLAAAESLVLGPLGSQGWVSFKALTSLALGHAPPDADRATVVDGIGRGIGRVAAHEFGHQILPGTDLHSSDHHDSYEYASADRQALFYGRINWDFAAPLLARKLSLEDGETFLSSSPD